MPELPEVESSRRMLLEHCKGATVVDVTAAEDAVRAQGGLRVQRAPVAFFGLNEVSHENSRAESRSSSSTARLVSSSPL